MISKTRTFHSVFWAGLLAVMALSSCDHQEPPLVLTKPMTRDTVVTRTYLCQIHSRRNIDIRAPELGYLEKVHVKEGQRVKEGDQMFTIMSQARNAALKRAEAEEQAAKAQHENMQRLLKTSGASDKQLTAAKAKWDQKQTELRLVQAQPGFTIINAPFNGLMHRLRLGNGSLVKKGDVLTTLSDNSKMGVDFKVPEAHYLEYSSSMPTEEMKQVKLMMANGRMFDQTGRLAPTEALVNKKTGTISLRAVFPNPKDLLRHGGTGNILMQTMLKNALLVPQQATFELLAHHYVYVVDENHVIRKKKISITQELEGLFVVADGVSANDTIIFEGVAQVHDGEKARDYRFEEPAVAYSHLKTK